MRSAASLNQSLKGSSYIRKRTNGNNLLQQALPALTRQNLRNVMKRILIVAAAATFMLASCSTQDKQARVATENALDSLQTEMVRQHTIDSMNAVTATAMANMPKQNDAMAPVVKKQVVVVRKPATHTVASNYTGGSYAGYNNDYNNAYNSAPAYSAPTYSNSTPAYNYNTPAYTQAAPQKKGWSAKATGAAIGAGAGILTGVLADKHNKGRGAIIGGVVGALAGLGTGAIIDHKNGR